MKFVEPIRDKNKIEQVKNILAENGTRDLLLFTMGINVGCRISDLLKLKIEDVAGKSEVEIKEQKTDKRKKFYINPNLQELITQFTTGKAPETYLFKSREGNKAITRQQAYNIINDACKKAGITEKLGTHTLRKTFGYHHYQKFHDVALLQKILNHSAPSVTLRYIGSTDDLILDNLKNFVL